MVKNRLAELQKGLQAEPVEEESSKTEKQKLKNGSKVGDQPLHIDMNVDDETFFATFDADVVENIDKIRHNVVEVDGLHKKILSSVNVDETAERRLKDLVEENKRLSRRIQTTIKTERSKVESGLEELKKTVGSNQRLQLSLRMRRTQIEAQSRRFFDVWNDYSAKQATFRDKSKELLVRRCKIANNSLNDDQIEEMLDEGKTDVFNECILSQTRMAQQQLVELQDRHDEFLKLEKSIREVHEMFLEISNLISQQGELINTIEFNVQSAYDKVSDAKDQLKQAETHQKSARRKKIICFAILLVAALIILFVVLAELGVFSSSS